MKTDELISKLANHVPPVRRLPTARRRFLFLFAVAITVFIGTLSRIGFRPDLAQVVGEAAFQVQTVLLFFLFSWSAFAALQLSVPGHRISDRQVNLTWGLLGLGVFSLAAAGLPSWSVSHLHSAVQSSRNCLDYISWVGLGLGLVFIGYLRRAAPLYPLQTGGLALLSSGSLSALTVQFLCKSQAPLHLLVGHYLPLVLVSVSGFLLGTFLLRSFRNFSATSK